MKPRGFLGYLASAVLAVVVYAIIDGGVRFKSKPSQKLFVKNSRRAATIQLYSTGAVPYRVVAEHSGYGAQTLPPDAKIGGFPDATSDREADESDGALTRK